VSPRRDGASSAPTIAAPEERSSNMFRISLIALSAAVAATAMVLIGSAAAAPKTVKGTVGPGFTISLTSGGKKVSTLKPGTYRFEVDDRSPIHDFHLIGPGVNKQITSVSFMGRKSLTVKLKKGSYRFVCDPHSSVMKGSFRVA
jgi:plastocyanin